MKESKKVPQGSPDVLPGCYERDPRSDLTQDHECWVALLLLAREKNENTFGILHALRCGGARLTVSNQSYRILPGEWNSGEYEQYKDNYLRPNAEIIKDLLSQIPSRLAAIRKVLSAEPRLRASGWTNSEIWHPGRFDNGWWMESLYVTLREQPEYEVGEITADYVELILRRSSGDIKHRLFRRPPGSSQRPQLFADQKSEEAV